MYHKAMNIQAQVDLVDGWIGGFSGTDRSTRQRILQAAYHEIHYRGYQAASIQSIIDQAGVTKGALYHHFRCKHDLVLALIDEVYSQYVRETFIQPLRDNDDPVSALIDILHTLQERITDESVALGCPLDNLAQEMTPIDEVIRQKLEQLYQYKRETIIAAFQRGQMNGTVNRNSNAESIALMVMATLQGCMGMAQSARSAKVLVQCGRGLVHYLEQLRGDAAEPFAGRLNKHGNDVK